MLALELEQVINDVPALNVRFVDVAKVTAIFEPGVIVEAFKFIVLMFELLEEKPLTVTA